MRLLSIGMTVGWLLGAWLVSSEAVAEPPHELAPPMKSSARTEVLLAIVGDDAKAARESLVALLDGQLRGMGLVLVEQEPAGSFSDWATGATQSKRALLAIVLDTKSHRGWRVVVVDAARGRAIARELPGGVEQDAASVEAVASIVISAASALREGLEVASAPVAAVVGDAPTRARESARRIPEPKHGRRPQTIAIHGTIGAAVASGAATSKGATLALGLAWRGRVEARIFGTLFWPVPIHSSFGEFRLNRALVGATSGPAFAAGAFTFNPEVGIVVERSRRSGTLPVIGIAMEDAVALHRFGGLVELRLRRMLLRPLSLEVEAGAAYLGRSLQFSARNGDSAPFLEIGPVMGFAQLGIDIATD